MKAKSLTIALSISFLSLCSLASKAQLINSFASGRTVNETDYANIIGTPYYNEKWNPGTVMFASNKVAENVPLKYNAKDDEVYFKDAKDETLAFSEPVKFFNFKDDEGKKHTFQSGYTGAPGVNEKSYLEVIADGKNQFLRKLSKTIVESKAYASSNTDRRFLDQNRYYVFSAGKLYTVDKKDTKSILAALPSKQAEVSKYVKDNSLNLKNDADIAKAFAYYNSL